MAVKSETTSIGKGNEISHFIDNSPTHRCTIRNSGGDILVTKTGHSSEEVERKASEEYQSRYGEEVDD